MEKQGDRLEPPVRVWRVGFVTEGTIENITWSLDLNDSRDLAGGGSEGRVLSRGKGRCKRRKTVRLV